MFTYFFVLQACLFPSWASYGSPDLEALMILFFCWSERVTSDSYNVFLSIHLNCSYIHLFSPRVLEVLPSATLCPNNGNDLPTGLSTSPATVQAAARSTLLP